MIRTTEQALELARLVEKLDEDYAEWWHFWSEVWKEEVCMGCGEGAEKSDQIEHDRDCSVPRILALLHRA